MLPKGQVQANIHRAPVFPRLQEWIRHVNSIPKGRQRTIVTHEAKRIKYRGATLGRLIRNYEQKTETRKSCVTSENDL